MVNYRLQEGQKNNAPEGERFSERYLKAPENQEVAALADKVISGNFSGNERVFLGNISDSNAKRVQELTGIDVTGFRIAIEARQIEHILKGHGTNGDTDHSMADLKNVAKIEYTLNNPDSIILAGTTRAYVSNVNGKNKPAKTVLYEKNIGEKSYYAVQAVADTKAKTLYVVSAFIGEQGYKKGTPQFTNAISPGATSETAAVDVPEKTIAQQGAEVKGNVRYSSRDNLDSEYMELAKDPDGNEVALDEMVRDAAEKAGFVYKRNTKRKHAPANAVPWQMFVKGIDNVLDNYGKYTYYATDAGAIPIGELMPRIQELSEEFYGSTLPEEVIDPQDIVMSAGIWDDMEFVQYLWDNYLEDIWYQTGRMPAIVTNDGMLVMDEDSTRVKSGAPVEYDDDGNVIPLSKRFDSGNEDIRFSQRISAEERVETEIQYLKKLVQIRKRGKVA